MGTWGPGPLENDTAADWMVSIMLGPDLSATRDALERVEFASARIEQRHAEEALAACELVARLLGPVGFACDEASAAQGHPWTPPIEMVFMAISVIDRVRGADSDLAQAWDGADFDAWTTQVENLRARLTERLRRQVECAPATPAEGDR